MPIALHAPAELSGLGELARAREHRQTGRVDLKTRSRCLDHLPRMAEKSEAGDVGRAPRPALERDRGGHTVEPQHARDRARQAFSSGDAVLRRRRDDAGAERLGEEHPVAGSQTALDQNPIGMDAAGHAEPVLRLGVDDGVPARDHAARLGDLVAAAAEDLRDDFLRHLAREACDREREHHLAAHSVDIGHRVHRRDGAPRPRVVDDRRKEVDGLDDREVGRHAIDRRVVRRAEPDEQIRGRRRPAGPQDRQHLLAISRSHFGRSAGAGGV